MVSTERCALALLAVKLWVMPPTAHRHGPCRGSAMSAESAAGIAGPVALMIGAA